MGKIREYVTGDITYRRGHGWDYDYYPMSRYYTE